MGCGGELLISWILLFGNCFFAFLSALQPWWKSTLAAVLLKWLHSIPTTCFVFRQVAVCLHVFFVCGAVYEKIMIWVTDVKKTNKKKQQHILACNHFMCMKENSWIRKFMERASIEMTWNDALLQASLSLNYLRYIQLSAHVTCSVCNFTHVSLEVHYTTCYD